MKTVGEILKKMPGMFAYAAIAWISLLSCSTVKEQGEPSVGEVPEITNDVQRKTIYESGGEFSPQNANPIPPSNQLGLQEKAS